MIAPARFKILLLKAILSNKKKRKESQIYQPKIEVKPVITTKEINLPLEIPKINLPREIKPEKAIIEVATVKEIEPEKVEGVEIEEPISIKNIRLKEEEEDVKSIDIRYPLIPRNPKPGERVFASAHICWDPKQQCLVYHVIEPELSEEDKKRLNDLKRIITEKLDVEFTALKREDVKRYLMQKFLDVINSVYPRLPKEKKEDLLYYITRDFLGLEKIEPLMHDPYIEDISCDGVGIPIFVNHRNPKIGSIRTNVVFESAEELDRFVIKLAQRCGKTLTVAQPLLDATLPDGSRLQATLGTDIARRGSNFTIRKFTEEPITPITLIKYGTIDFKVMAYLWFLVEHKRSILIGGGTATGKTTLLNAIAMFIPQEAKIVTIEDTAELRLPHPHWLPHVARKAFAEVGGKKVGEVDMFDLLVESLRQRPDYIVVGEVRGKEAFVLFQQMATGHAGLATIHADTMEKLIDRLTTPPINLPGSLIETLDAIVFLSRIKRGRSYVRRVTGVYEIVGYDKKHETPVVNAVFLWDPKTDSFKQRKSVALKRIGEQLGISEEKIKIDLQVKMTILKWAYDKGYENYEDFSKVVKLYYNNPKKLFEMIMGEQ